jgi:hypothetical protein
MYEDIGCNILWLYVYKYWIPILIICIYTRLDKIYSDFIFEEIGLKYIIIIHMQWLEKIYSDYMYEILDEICYDYFDFNWLCYCWRRWAPMRLEPCDKVQFVFCQHSPLPPPWLDWHHWWLRDKRLLHSSLLPEWPGTYAPQDVWRDPQRPSKPSANERQKNPS